MAVTKTIDFGKTSLTDIPKDLTSYLPSAAQDDEVMISNGQENLIDVADKDAELDRGSL